MISDPGESPSCKILHKFKYRRVRGNRSEKRVTVASAAGKADPHPRLSMFHTIRVNI